MGWRIKTREECGEQIPLGFNTSGRMNYLMGQPIGEKYWKDCEKGNAFIIDDWYIRPQNYIKIPEEVNFTRGMKSVQNGLLIE